MKKIFIVTTSLLIALVFSGFTSVSAEEEPCVPGYQSFQYGVLAGQHIEAGNVIVDTDGNNLTFDINTIGEFDELHLGVYNSIGDIPLGNGGRPIPGQMPFKYVYDPPTQTAFIELTASQLLGVGVELVDWTEYIIVLHFQFTIDGENPVSGETGYAGEYDGSGNAWFYAMEFTVTPTECEEPPGEEEYEYETAWLFGNPNNEIDGYKLNKWGWHVDMSTLDGNPIPVYAAAGQNDISKGMLVGYVTIVGNILTLEIFEELDLTEIHLHAGDTPLPLIERGSHITMTDAPGLFGVVLHEVEDNMWSYELPENTEYIALHMVVGVMLTEIEPD